ncbi:hypothetical protein EPN90_03510 [Patescibacteria group bacterium]|nr:MAG: hypothetical protein EPN90_03510 [Patescibacteria group bacterium]
MRNENYNLLKLLHNSLDDQWRLEKHYLKDAKKCGCKSCSMLLGKLRNQLTVNIAALQKELAMHMGKKGKLS